jgi:hypothetical protein
MISNSKINEILFIIDEFRKEFEKAKDGYLLKSDNDLKRRNRSFKLFNSKVITILVLFHYGQFRNLKYFI